MLNISDLRKKKSNKRLATVTVADDWEVEEATSGLPIISSDSAATVSSSKANNVQE